MAELIVFEICSCYLLNQLLQEESRFNPKTLPLIIPYFSIASTVYSEQVGLYLHPPPKRYLRIGDSVIL